MPCINNIIEQAVTLKEFWRQH